MTFLGAAISLDNKVYLQQFYSASWPLMWQHRGPYLSGPPGMDAAAELPPKRSLPPLYLHRVTPICQRFAKLVHYDM